MKTIALFLLLASLRCGFGQTDTNVIAVGDWSEPVSDSDGHTLRGRLLVYDEQNAPNHARIYLELQHVFKSAWYNPLEIYFDIGLSDDLHFEMRDKLDQPVPQYPVVIRGPAPSPCWVTLPCDSTVRLRADTYTLGPPSKPDGLEILVRGGCWLIRPNATNDFFLSGSFTPATDHPSPLKYHVWQGTLKLPKVNIPVQSFAADEPLIPAPLNALLPKITSGMTHDHIKKVLSAAYPKLEPQDGPWSGQTGYIGFHLDEQFSAMFSARMDAEQHAVVSTNALILVFDRTQKLRLNITHYCWDDKAPQK